MKWKQNPKIRFLKFFEQSMYGFFLILSIKLQQHKGLKFFQMIFWKKTALVFLHKKWPKTSFLSLVTNRCIEFSDLLHEVAAA